MKKIRKILVTLLTVFVMLISSAVPAQAAALPNVSSNKYIKTYTYAYSGKVYGYTDYKLTKKNGRWIDCSADECYILEVKNNAVKVSYPTSKGRNTCWFKRSDFCKGDMLADGVNRTFYADKNMTLYKWKNNNTKYKTISLKTKCHILRGNEQSEWLQVLVEDSSIYYMGWVKGAELFATPDNYVKVADGVYQFKTALNTGYVLDVYNNGKTNGTNINVWPNVNSIGQKFKIKHIKDGWYSITDVNSNLVLDVSGSKKGNGVNVALWTWHGKDNQLFRFYKADNGCFYVRNKLGYYIDVLNGKASKGQNVHMWEFHGGKAAQWEICKTTLPSPTPSPTPAPTPTPVVKTTVKLNSTNLTLTGNNATVLLNATVNTGKTVTWRSSNTGIVSVSGGRITAKGNGTAVVTATADGASASCTVTVINCVSGSYQRPADGIYQFKSAINKEYVLDVSGAGVKNGTNVQIWGNANVTQQKFKIKHIRDGWYSITDANSGKVLDVKGGKSGKGVNIQLWSWNGGDSQLFRFYKASDGYYIQNKLSYIVDVSGGKAGDGKNVHTWEYHGGKSQQWELAKTTLPKAVTPKQGGEIIIKGINIGYKYGDYFTDNGKACVKCHGGHGGNFATNEAYCNCKCTAKINGTTYRLGGIQCLGFARYVQSCIYKTNEYAKPSKFKTIQGSHVAAGKLTASKIKQLVTTAGVGGHIRTGKGAHSMIISQVDSTGFTIIQANGSNNQNYKGYYRCRIGYTRYTWQGYVNSTYGKRGIEYIKVYK